VLSLSGDGSDMLNDARVMDLDMRVSPASRVISANGTLDHLLLYRIRIEDGGIQLAGDARDHQYIATVECEIGGTDDAAAFAHGLNTAWLGNHFVGSLTSHVVRLNYSSRTVVAHNRIEGTQATGVHELTVRCEYEDLPECRHWIIADNEIVGGVSDLPVTIGNGSSGHNEQSNDVIVERNYVLSGTNSYALVSVFADGVTVRKI
jgi:hypothetical protein